MYPVDGGILSITELATGYERFKLVLMDLQSEVTQARFGNPATGTTRDEICLYDAAFDPVVELAVDRAG